MIDIAVVKNVELIQTIIYLAGASPTQCLNNREYCEKLDKWFLKFKDHETVKETHEMILHDHFTYDRPHRAALRLDELLEDESEKYHKWALMVERFSTESGFDAFFEREKAYFQRLVDKVKSTNFEEWVAWADKFWSCKNDSETHQVISVIDGNYGISLKRRGQTENFIIRCLPAFDKAGNEFWPKGRLANGVIHEYAHTFVNPIVEAHTDILKRNPSFFAAHTNMMSSYNTDYAVMNEYIVRAFTILFLEKFNFEDVSATDEIARHKKNFPYIEEFVEFLRNFSEKGERFEDFYVEQIGPLGTELGGHK